MKLSDRLEAVISMVSPGNAAVDVGCDHAYVPIELADRGICPCCIASDVNKGPLDRAAAHIRERGLTEKILPVLADGIPAGVRGMISDHFYEGGTTPRATLITSGMGGLLMRDICGKAGEDFRSFEEYVASPQRDADIFRRFLRESGLRITREKMIEEDGKYYPVICAVRGGTADWPGAFLPAADLYGPVLLAEKDPVLRKYLLREERMLTEIEARLGGGGGPAKRREEILAALKLNRLAQKMTDDHGGCFR